MWFISIVLNNLLLKLSYTHKKDFIALEPLACVGLKCVKGEQRRKKRETSQNPRQRVGRRLGKSSSQNAVIELWKVGNFNYLCSGNQPKSCDNLRSVYFFKSMGHHSDWESEMF